MISSRRHVLADDSAQTHALSPSIMKKNVRKVARRATVATPATSEATPPTPAEIQAWIPRSTNPKTAPTAGGTDRSFSVAWKVDTDVEMASRTGWIYGMKAMAMMIRVAMITNAAPRKTAAAALIRDHPR